MALFAVSYDLHLHRDYGPITRELQRLGGARILESLWIVVLNNTHGEVRDHLAKYIDGDDALLVLELPRQTGWATRRVKKGGLDILKANTAP